MKENKIAYTAPEVSVWGVTVEEGFAVSGSFDGGLSGFDDGNQEIGW